MKLMDKFLERNKAIDYHSWQDNFWYFLSVPVVKILQYTPITPNLVTFSGVFAVYLAALFFALNHPFIAVILLYVSEWTDRMDGALARVKNQKSVLRCELLCKWYHHCSFALLFVGIGLSLYNNNFYFIGQMANEYWLLAGFLAAFSQQFTAYFLGLRDFLLLKHMGKEKHSKKIFIEGKFQSLIFKIITLPNVWLFHILLIGVLFNKLDWLLVFYALFLPIRAVLFIMHTYYNFLKIEKKKVVY